MAEKHPIYDEEGYPEFEGMSAAHVELWDWLANNPGKDKKEWPGWEGHVPGVGGIYNGFEIGAHCFLCEAMSSAALDQCDECPLTDNGRPNCFDNAGLYPKWERAKKAGDYRTACELARQIRDAWRW